MTTIASGTIIKGNGKDIHVVMNNIVNKEVARQLQHERWEHEREITLLKKEIENRDQIIKQNYETNAKINAIKMAEYTKPEKKTFITQLEKHLAFVICCIYLAGSELCKFILRRKKK